MSPLEISHVYYKRDLPVKVEADSLVECTPVFRKHHPRLSLSPNVQHMINDLEKSHSIIMPFILCSQNLSSTVVPQNTIHDISGREIIRKNISPRIFSQILLGPKQFEEKDDLLDGVFSKTDDTINGLSLVVNSQCYLGLS